MIPRRIYDHIRNHNWFAVLTHLYFVCIGSVNALDADGQKDPDFIVDT